MVIDGGSGGRGRAGGDTRPRRGPRSGRDRRLEQPQTVIRLPKDPYRTDYPAPRARRARVVLALAAVTVVVAAVIALNSHGGGKGDGAQGASTGVGGGVPPATASTGVGGTAGSTGGDAGAPAFPSLTSQGALTGYPDTQDGAKSAAANYFAAIASEAMVHPDSRHKLIAAIADPGIVTDLQQRLDEAFARGLKGFGLDAEGNPPKGQTLVYRNVPIGVSVQSYANDKAVVAVWGIGISGIAGPGSTQPVTQTWNTLTTTLTWVGGDWRMNAFDQADGPTPVSTQQASVPADIQKAVEQFSRLRYAP